MTETKKSFKITVREKGTETRVLIVGFPGDTTQQIIEHYQMIRNIPDTHILNISYTGNFNTWQKTYDNYVALLKDKLNELGPKNIQYIVLINAPRLVKYTNMNLTRNVSTVTLTMVAYNLKKENNIYNRNNPYWRGGAKETFKYPWARFDHNNTPSYSGIIYMVGCFEGERAIAQINNSFYAENNVIEGYQIVDNRYGTLKEHGDVHDISDQSDYWGLDTYPHNWKYSYMDMDRKLINIIRYYDTYGITNYKWHPYGSVVGAPGSESGTFSNPNFEDGTPVEIGIKTLGYVGWYSGIYYDIYDWQPGSYYTQVHSGFNAPKKAWEAGCTFVCGPLFEPYTSGVIQPTEFVYYINQGYTYGEAVLYSLPSFLWANWTCGDPLTKMKK